MGHAPPPPRADSLERCQQQGDSPQIKVLESNAAAQPRAGRAAGAPLKSLEGNPEALTGLKGYLSEAQH